MGHNKALLLPRIPPPAPVLYFAITPLSKFGDMYVHKTLQIPPQNTPFPGLNLKVGKMNYNLGKFDPNWEICSKHKQTFLEVGKKKLFCPGWTCSAKGYHGYGQNSCTRAYCRKLLMQCLFCSSSLVEFPKWMAQLCQILQNRSFLQSDPNITLVTENLWTLCLEATLYCGYYWHCWTKQSGGLQWYFGKPKKETFAIKNHIIKDDPVAVPRLYPYLDCKLQLPYLIAAGTTREKWSKGTVGGGEHVLHVDPYVLAKQQ